MTDRKQSVEDRIWPPLPFKIGDVKPFDAKFGARVLATCAMLVWIAMTAPLPVTLALAFLFLRAEMENVIVWAYAKHIRAILYRLSEAEDGNDGEGATVHPLRRDEPA